MKRDKAELAYRGEPQLARAQALLRKHVAEAFVSVRADQANDPARASHPTICDAPGASGPTAGILAAQDAHPEAAWLVLACDLPYLDDTTLGYLTAHRDATRVATAFRSAHDGEPEPLCAIWEPASRALLASYVAGGGRCPRKFLGSHATHLLALPRSNALDNVNAADEYWAAMESIDGEARPLSLSVQYFALLREQARTAAESLATRARTPRELFAELSAKHGFTLAPEHLRVAVNAEFGDWDQPLVDGDAVVFIPPVAGG
jgi:molybdopterin-guanine dinucleotide biosynthesis protein A